MSKVPIVWLQAEWAFVSLPKQPVELWPTQHPISVFTPIFSPCFCLYCLGRCGACITWLTCLSLKTELNFNFMFSSLIVVMKPHFTNQTTGNILQNIIHGICLICELLLQVPTLIVYGENDSTPMAKQAPNNLRILPNSQEVCLKNAGHAAYLDQPDVFHKMLYNFMELLHHWWGKCFVFSIHQIRWWLYL